MPLSRFISDVEHLIREFRSEAPTSIKAYGELRLAVARLHEMQRQLDVAREKLMSVIAIAEMEIVHELVDFSATEPSPENRFLMDENSITGVAAIDDEHRALMELGNRVYLLSRAESVTAAEVGAALQELIEHTRDHFATEERLMEEIQFPERDKHRTVHEKMLEYLEEMMEFVPTRPLVVAIKLEKFLGSWFIWHMQKDDVALTNCYLAARPRTITREASPNGAGALGRPSPKRVSRAGDSHPPQPALSC